MSGFFALRRSTLEAGRDFNPIGYKIGLELIIKCRCTRVVETPIHFTDRRFGESKVSLKEQLKYLQHVRRLYLYKYGTWSHLAQFLVVGLSGLFVNLLVLTILLRIGTAGNTAAGVVAGTAFNFLTNRYLVFRRRHVAVTEEAVTPRPLLSAKQPRRSIRTECSPSAACRHLRPQCSTRGRGAARPYTVALRHYRGALRSCPTNPGCADR